MSSYRSTLRQCHVCLSLDSRNSVRVLPLSCRPWQGVARKELREEGRRERRERRVSSAGVGVAWRGRSRIEGGSYGVGFVRRPGSYADRLIGIGTYPVSLNCLVKVSKH